LARIDAHAALILGLIEQKSDITRAEIQSELARAGVAAGIGTIWRFFDRHRITRKKSRRMRPNRTVPTS
jgi:transposase